MHIPITLLEHSRGDYYIALPRPYRIYVSATWKPRLHNFVGDCEAKSSERYESNPSPTL